MKAVQLAREAVAAYDHWMEQKPWERIGQRDLMVLDLPDRGLVLGSVMGSGGEEFGLMLLEGPDALSEFEAMKEDSSIEEAVLTSRFLAVGRAHRREVPPPFDQIPAQAGRTGSTVPLFMVKEPGRDRRPPRRAELEALVHALNALLRAYARGFQAQGWTEGGVLPVVRARGDAREPETTFRLARIVAGRLEDPDLPAVVAPPGMAELPRRETTYLVGLPRVLDPEILDRRFLAVFDEDTEGLALPALLESDDPREAAHRLFEALRGEGDPEDGLRLPAALPRQILFSSEMLYSTMEGALAALGVECAYDMGENLTFENLVEPFRTSDWASPELPDADDHEGWLDACRRLDEWLTRAGARRVFDSQKAWRRFFGGGSVVIPGPDTSPFDRMRVLGFVEWFLFHHRASKRSRTVAERIAEEDLDPGERIVLEERMQAIPSIHRVEAIVDGGALELVDVLSDQRCRVTEPTLAETAEPGMGLVASVYPAGSFHFMAFVGPALPSRLVQPALDYLESIGLRLGRSLDPGGVHLLGRLWRWAEEHAAFSPDVHVTIRGQELDPFEEDEPSTWLGGAPGSGAGLSAEAFALAREAMERRFMGWLDEPIPMLGGHTPRQACATEGGRRKVAHMIRTYDDPGGMSGVRVPRERMLAELGLLEGGEAGGP